jgi:hypothetical protein
MNYLGYNYIFKKLKKLAFIKRNSMDVTKYLIILILIDTQLILYKFLLMNILCFPHFGY